MNSGNTIWEKGRFDSNQGKRQLLFGRMYEDALIELEAFRERGRILCIASAGCTAMKLAAFHDEIVAVDINPLQIMYVKERFSGSVGYRGGAEKIMSVMRFFGPIVGWRTKFVREFVNLNLPQEQISYWEKHLNTFRFRKIFDFLFSRLVLKMFYSSNLLNTLPDQLGVEMRERMKRCFSNHSNRNNPYIRSLLLGEISTDFSACQTKNIRLVIADVLHFLESEPPQSFNGYTFSNILDGADDVYRQKLFNEIRRTAVNGAMVVFRSFKNTVPSNVINRAVDDRSVIWGSVFIQPAAEL